MSDVKSVEEKVQEFKKSKQDELADLDLQIKREELEQLRLTREERQYSIRKLKQDLADREVKDLQKSSDRETRGLAFRRDKTSNELRWKSCTHKKGGNVSERDMKVLHYGGNSEQYAVIRHMFPNGDIWTHCQRCGKTWKPPVKANFYFDDRGVVVPEKLGKFDQERFDKVLKEYHEALQFPTKNTMSSSHVFSFVRINEKGERIDAKEETRLAMKDVDLT
jgi:hypothetical protein